MDKRKIDYIKRQEHLVDRDAAAPISRMKRLRELPHDYLEEYPMPMIYDRDDSDDYDEDIIDRRSIDPYDLDAPRRAGTQLTAKHYVYGTAAVCTFILVLILIANVRAG